MRRFLYTLCLFASLTLPGFVSVASAALPKDAMTLINEVAADTGKSKAQLEKLLAGASRQQSIIDAITRPAESLTWPRYRRIFITPDRIKAGRAFYQAHKHLVDKMATRYGVPGAYIVAILGIETNYGRITGNYRVIDALYTLAFYYPPRASFFRSELKTLLELPAHSLSEPLNSLKGSYAGAQGWGQFMPSSIKAYAVDGDGDGRIDLMNSLPDILASVAHYFQAHGWQPNASVAVSTNACTVRKSDKKSTYSVGQWKQRGCQLSHQVPTGEKARFLSFTSGKTQPQWLVFNNFSVIMRYNHSPMYAMVVHQLARAIGRSAYGMPSGGAS